MIKIQSRKKGRNTIIGIIVFNHQVTSSMILYFYTRSYCKLLLLLLIIMFIISLLSRLLQFHLIYLHLIGLNALDIHDSFVSIIDKDNSTFAIRRLPHLPTQIGSCYEIQKEEQELRQFCYPAVLISGIPKCGTSALFEFLRNQDGIHAGHKTSKEYCLRTSNYYDYFLEFPHKPALNGQFFINGCIYTNMNVEIHNLIKPQSIYIVMVRDLSERMWAAYNFWCRSIIDKNCGEYKWIKYGMYRSPEDFHETLMKANYEYNVLNYKWNCLWLDNLYMDAINMLYNMTKQQPLVIASESLTKSNNYIHITRLQDYINQNFHTNRSLDIKHLHYINTGGAVGPNTQATELSRGLYNISNYKPLLKETHDYIYSCWKSCSYINSETQYNYPCKH